MKKPNVAVFTGVVVVALVASALAFVNNLSVVAKWALAFHRTGGDSTQMATSFSGIIPWLDWSAVDYSCVSTFIPFFGFLLILRGLCAIRRKDGQKPDPEFFPFFPSFDRLNITLGLVGTLWGIILIGYYDMDTVTMSDLMMCIHTALFSTLVAVVWVFIIDHPILRPMMHAILANARPGIDESDEPDEIFKALKASADGLREAWAAERDNVASFAAALDESRQSLDGFANSVANSMSTVNERISAIEQAQAKLNDVVSSITDTIASLKDAAASQNEEFKKTIADFRTGLDAHSAEVAKTMDAARAGMDAQNEQIAKTVAAVRESMGAQDEQFAKTLAAVREGINAQDGEFARTMDTIRKGMDAQNDEFARTLDSFRKDVAAGNDEFAKTLKKYNAELEAAERRIADKAAESEANAQRASSAETLLGAIRSAIK